MRPEAHANARLRPTFWSGWREVVGGTLRASVSDRVALAAAGCAFFATLSLFPALSMLVSLYGLVSSPRAVEQQVLWLRDLLPPAAYWLVADRLHHLAGQPQGRLGVGFVAGLLITWWSAGSGMRSILSALTIAYGGQEDRSFLRYFALAVGLTVVAILAAVLATIVLVAMPALFNFVTPWIWRVRMVHTASVLLLIGFVGQSLALLYRFGPARARHVRPRIAPGVGLALVLWLLASLLLSLYVENIASFGATYGPLVAAVAVMLWFYVAAYAILLGGELNAQLDRRRAEQEAALRALHPEPV